MRGGAQSTAIFGVLQLDADDLPTRTTQQMRALITHEIGHVVGIGTLWANGGNAFLTGTNTSDPRFIGPDAVAEYKNTLGGADDDIPVANEGGPGTRLLHWRESTFDRELMTGYSESGDVVQPMSSMTIASVGDLGYIVNLGAADVCAEKCAPAPAPVASLVEPGEPMDRILTGPIVVVEPDGTTRIVRLPGS
jgi:hypothetical protein